MLLLVILPVILHPGVNEDKRREMLSAIAALNIQFNDAVLAILGSVILRSMRHLDIYDPAPQAGATGRRMALVWDQVIKSGGHRIDRFLTKPHDAMTKTAGYLPAWAAIPLQRFWGIADLRS